MRGANKEERHVGNWLPNRSVLVLMAVLLGPLGAPVAANRRTFGAGRARYEHEGSRLHATHERIRNRNTLAMTPRQDRSVPLRWIVSGSLVALLFAAWYLVTGPLGLVSSLKFPAPLDAYDLPYPAHTFAGLRGRDLGAAHPFKYRAGAHRVLAGNGYRSATWITHGRNRLVDGYVNPVFQLIRPIAPIAWIPLTILWFGLGMGAKLFVIWLAAFAPAVINTYTGVRNIDTIVIHAARVHGASSKEMLFDVVIPGALPSIFTGLRTSLQACWMVLVAAELVGSFVGLGHIMIIASRDLDSGMILVAMICVALLGVLMSAGLTYVERYAIPWRR